MKAIIDLHQPDAQFWEQYNELWKNSFYKSVFQSPHILQHFAQEVGFKIGVYKCYQGDKLIGAAFFRKHRKRFCFLSDVKNDHNFFVICSDCTEEMILEYFDLLFKTIKQKNYALILNSQPSWASYRAAFFKAIKENQLFWNTSKISVCPMLEAANPKELFSTINQSKNIRNKTHLLKRDKNFDFEVFTGEEDFNNWVDEFCQLHIKRWKDTPTPSKLESKKEQTFLKSCFQSWLEDEILIRFAIRAEGRRIAFAVGLLQGKTMIGHSSAFDPEYYKYSPGKVLLLQLAKWMEEQELMVLDFGFGAESYKYRFANKTPDLDSFFISNRRNLTFIIEAKIVKLLRENARIIKFYREKLKPFNHNLRKRLSNRA